MRRRRHKKKRVRRIRADVRPRPPGRYQVVVPIVIVVVLMGLFLVALFSKMGWIRTPGDTTAAAPALPVPETTIFTESHPQFAGGAILLPDVDTDEPTVRFYAFHSSDGRATRFLVARMDDGRSVVTLDTCRECIESRQGHALNGHGLVCRTCGRLTPLDAIGREDGRCRPIVLPIETTAQGVRIRIEDLRNGGGP